MRHSLAQLLAASSGRGSAREASAACSLPAEGAPGRGGSSNSSSPGEAAAEEAALRRAAANLLDDAEDEEDELLFPAGLELDDWLEAAAAPGWETGGGGGSSSPSEAEPPPPGPGAARPGSNRLKAAAAARLNRQKKKQYVLGLESRLQGLAAENRQLRDRNRGLCRRLRHLERETGYLRAVLANQSALGRLLSRLAGEGAAGRVGLRISTSLFEDHAAAVAAAPLETLLPCESHGGGSSSDHDYALPVPKEEEEEEGGDCDEKRATSSSPGGICLHVDQDQVSVEFCSVCARRAASSAFAAASISPSSFASKMCLPCQAPLCRG